MRPSSPEERLLGLTHKRSEVSPRNADRNSLANPETFAKAVHGHGATQLAGAVGRPCVYAFLAISILKPESSAIAGCFCLRKDAGEPFDESVPVLVVFKYLLPFYPTTNDVVQRSRNVYF